MHCQYCELKFPDCLFFRYSVISLILALIILGASFLIEGDISKLLIVSVFTLIIVYGYFFDKSTENIIKANFAQRKAKEALQELTGNLQQKVDEQTKDIKEAYEVEKRSKEELESLDKAKNQFLLAIQHHLRTPLTSMVGYSDLILSGAYGKQSDKTKEVVKRFQVSTNSLIKMVNEFLDITQFQLGKGVVSLNTEVDMGSVIREIIDDLKLGAETKGIYLKLEEPKEPCIIKADSGKIKAALFNIIDNAVKYTNKGGVGIKIENQEKGGPKVKIIIRDTGIGISPENLKILFTKTFQRGEEAKKLFVTGRGIGLYISSQIIKAHNGKIWAESEGEGKGSVFNIELPKEQEPEKSGA